MKFRLLVVSISLSTGETRRISCVETGRQRNSTCSLCCTAHERIEVNQKKKCVSFQFNLNMFNSQISAFIKKSVDLIATNFDAVYIKYH